MWDETPDPAAFTFTTADATDGQVTWLDPLIATDVAGTPATITVTGTNIREGSRICYQVRQGLRLVVQDWCRYLVRILLSQGLLVVGPP